MSSEYTVTVTFTRFHHEDDEVAGAKYPELPLDQALRLQLRDELQEACDAGLAGLFQVGEVGT